LLAATPTAHWLEYVDWADPVLEAPARLKNGHVVVPDQPGLGMRWNERAVRKFLVG
jgi:mandelate racemase